MTKEDATAMMQAFENKREEFELLIIKAQYLLEQFIPLMTHLVEQTEYNASLEAENADLRNQLRDALERC